VASFAGHSFRYRGSGGRTFPIWDKKTIYNAKERPNADTTLTTIGMDVQRLAAAVRCTKAQLIVLYGDVLASGSLVLAWETHNAFLESIDNAFLVVTGQDVYEATLHFTRL
jgi:hypothetical protein